MGSGGLWSGLVFGCRVVSTRVARSSRPGSTGLEVVKLVEPSCGRQRAGRVETILRMSGGLWSGLVFGCRVVSTRVARSSRPGSTGLEVVKLVEPSCERQRAGRVETMVRMVERAVRGYIGCSPRNFDWRSLISPENNQCSFRQACDANDACWRQVSVFSRARRRSLFRLAYRQL